MRFAVVALSFAVAALLSLGMVMLISASIGRPGISYLYLQPIWCCLGVIAMAVAAVFDYRLLKRRPWLIWALFAVVLVLLALVPVIGPTIKGAQRWLKFGPVTVQPSELAKIALILILAWYGDRYQRWMPSFLRGMVIPFTLTGLILGLVFIEPDVGTTVLLAAVSSLVLIVAGTRILYIIPVALVGTAGLALFILNNPVRLERVMGFIDPAKKGSAVNYQTDQSVIAIGSGGWKGLGLGNGRQKLGFVPEHHTDFILSVVGEELGLIATLSVLVCFLLLMFSGFYIASKARDTFGMLLGTGLTALISLQAAINIGVVTGSLPNKGMSLPFLSYGGSNLIAMMACVGLLFNIARQAGEPERLLENQKSRN